MKELFKTKYKADINVGGKTFTFSKTSETEQGLIRLVKSGGLSISKITQITSFQISTEKRRGKIARKY